MITKRAEMRAPRLPLYSLPDAARAQMTSRGSAVARSTLEELKFVVPKSPEDIFDGWWWRLWYVNTTWMVI